MKEILEIAGLLASVGVLMFIVELLTAPMVIIPKLKSVFGLTEKSNRITDLERRVSELEAKLNVNK